MVKLHDLRRILAAHALLMMGFSLLVPLFWFILIYSFAISDYPSYTGTFFATIIGFACLIIGGVWMQIKLRDIKDKEVDE